MFCLVVEQVSHTGLRQPERVLHKPAFDAGTVALGFVEEEFAGGGCWIPVMPLPRSG